MSEQLTEEQKNFIPHILAHVFPEKAAEIVSMPIQTVRAWMKQPSFRIELERHRRAVITHIMLALEQAAIGKAVITLSDLVMNAKTEHVRVKAADSILYHTARYHEMAGFEERLRQLEDVAEKAQIVIEQKKD